MGKAFATGGGGEGALARGWCNLKLLTAVLEVLRARPRPWGLRWDASLEVGLGKAGRRGLQMGPEGEAASTRSKALLPGTEGGGAGDEQTLEEPPQGGCE